jgi:hypothetical protein
MPAQTTQAALAAINLRLKSVEALLTAINGKLPAGPPQQQTRSS